MPETSDSSLYGAEASIGPAAAWCWFEWKLDRKGEVIGWATIAKFGFVIALFDLDRRVDINMPKPEPPYESYRLQLRVRRCFVCFVSKPIAFSEIVDQVQRWVTRDLRDGEISAKAFSRTSVFEKHPVHDGVV